MTLVLRCAPCAHVEHHRCDGPAACCCSQCFGAQIIANARRRIDSANDTGQLRFALAQVLALAIQKQSRRAKLSAAQPVSFGPCRCGCGQAVFGSPYGARKLYASRSCSNRAYLGRKRQREAQEAARPAEGIDFSAPGWTGTADWWEMAHPEDSPAGRYFQRAAAGGSR